MPGRLLYQINTRVFLDELGTTLGRRATLADVPDAFLDACAARGFAWLWFLGVWQTGDEGLRRARAYAGGDGQHVVSSPFAITAYQAHVDFGGDAALAALRARLHARGLRLLLDFVPNHTAIDHPWAGSHPAYYVHGTDDDLAREPHNYVRVETALGPRVLAHGRDPHFAGWTDTLQLNLRHAGLREALTRELVAVASRCDGVRCDMAMLLDPEIIARTWNARSTPADGTPAVDAPFWPAAIAQVRAANPTFSFVAEVYWGLEERLQEQGFDATYDKELYDRLRDGPAAAVRARLGARLRYQERLVRFLENHDEPRAAAAFTPWDRHRACATVALLAPGLALVHEGQLEGRRVRVPMQVGRRPDEPLDARTRDFYEALLSCASRPEVAEGRFTLLEPRSAWPDNPSHAGYVAFLWERGDARLLVVVNLAPTRGQCWVRLPVPALAGRSVILEDVLGAARYERSGNDLLDVGLYLDEPGWAALAFAVR